MIIRCLNLNPSENKQIKIEKSQIMLIMNTIYFLYHFE